MRKSSIVLSAILFGCAMSAYADHDVVTAGTNISVRTNEPIDSRHANNSGDLRVYSAVVAQDVIDRDGQVAIPRGANAELVVRNVDRDEMTVDLDSVTVNGRRYVVASSDQAIEGGQREGIGKNRRTG